MSKKTGLVLGGLILVAAAGIGGWFLAKKYKGDNGTSGLRGLGTPTLYGDWNTNQLNAFRRQQGMLYHQRRGIPQVF
jgi:hypothetical protein